VNWFNYLHCQ